MMESIETTREIIRTLLQTPGPKYQKLAETKDKIEVGKCGFISYFNFCGQQLLSTNSNKVTFRPNRGIPPEQFESKIRIPFMHALLAAIDGRLTGTF